MTSSVGMSVRLRAVGLTGKREKTLGKWSELVVNVGCADKVTNWDVSFAAKV